MATKKKRAKKATAPKNVPVKRKGKANGLKNTIREMLKNVTEKQTTKKEIVTKKIIMSVDDAIVMDLLHFNLPELVADKTGKIISTMDGNFIFAPSAEDMGLARVKNLLLSGGSKKCRVMAFSSEKAKDPYLDFSLFITLIGVSPSGLNTEYPDRFTWSVNFKVDDFE
jgi:ribosomal protein S8E